MKNNHFLWLLQKYIILYFHTSQPSSRCAGSSQCFVPSDAPISLPVPEATLTQPPAGRASPAEPAARRAAPAEWDHQPRRALVGLAKAWLAGEAGLAATITRRTCTHLYTCACTRAYRERSECADIVLEWCVRPPVHPSTCPSVCPCVRLPVRPFVYPSACLSVL